MITDIADINTSDWTEKDGAKERSLKYVMHMVSPLLPPISCIGAKRQNNYIGPKKSDCIGSERVEVEKPDEVYEIVSSTQTPDVPSGKRQVPPTNISSQADKLVSRSIPGPALPVRLKTGPHQRECTVRHNVTGPPHPCSKAQSPQQSSKVKRNIINLG
jgi:hypothetical protein